MDKGLPGTFCAFIKKRESVDIRHRLSLCPTVFITLMCYDIMILSSHTCIDAGLRKDTGHWIISSLMLLLTLFYDTKSIKVQ